MHSNPRKNRIRFTMWEIRGGTSLRWGVLEGGVLGKREFLWGRDSQTLFHYEFGHCERLAYLTFHCLQNFKT